MLLLIACGDQIWPRQLQQEYQNCACLRRRGCTEGELLRIARRDEESNRSGIVLLSTCIAAPHPRIKHTTVEPRHRHMPECQPHRMPESLPASRHRIGWLHADASDSGPFTAPCFPKVVGSEHYARQRADSHNQGKTNQKQEQFAIEMSLCKSTARRREHLAPAECQ